MYVLLATVTAVIVACGVLVTYRRWLPAVVLVLYTAAFGAWVGGLSFRSYPLPAPQAVMDKLLQKKWNLLYGRIINEVAYVLTEDDPPRLFSLTMRDEDERKRVRAIFEGMSKGMAASLILRGGTYRIEGKWSPPPSVSDETKDGDG